MRRRDLIRKGAAAAAAVAAVPVVALVKDDQGERQETWYSAPCPGCGRPVAFLPAQRANQCGWCHTSVVRLGME